MLKKWLVCLFLPLLAVIALCPIGAPQAYAAQHYLTLNTNPSGGVGGTVASDAFGWEASWSRSGAVDEGTYYVHAYASPGYEFDHFDKDGSWYGDVESASVYVDHDTEIRAYFVPIPTYDLTVSVGEGSGSVYCAEIGGWGGYLYGIVNEGTYYFEAQPDYSYDFDGWYEGGSCVSTDSSMYYPVYNDTALAAHFYFVPILHTIEYNPGAGSGLTCYPAQQEDSTFYLPTPDDLGFTAPEGCTFDYWSIYDGSSYSTGYPGDEAWMGYSDLTITAMWTPTGPVYHNVNFITYEGSGSMPSMTVAEGDPFQLPECGFDPPEGKEFDSYSFGYMPGDWITMTTTDITMEAYFKDSVYYLVYIDPNGGTGYMADPYVKENDTYTLPYSEFTPPEGKYFAGWDKGQPGDDIVVTGDTSIIAQWYDIMCTVFIMPNGGSGYIPDPTLKYGTEYTLPECTFTPPSPDLVFKGWDLGQPGTKITLKSDVAINAIWGEEAGEYTFASGGGATWQKGSSDQLAFTVKRSKDDASTYSRFAGGKGSVSVDGKALASSDYTAASGSLKLNLLPAYLENLSAGTHTLSVSFDDGSASASFAVAGDSSKGGSNGSGSGSGSSSSGSGSGGSGSQTSGEFPLVTVMLGVIALALIAIIILLLKRKKN